MTIISERGDHNKKSRGFLEHVASKLENSGNFSPNFNQFPSMPGETVSVT